MAEQAFWGVTIKEAEQEPVLLWEENMSVIEWWLTIPDFLRFNNQVCIGMNVQSVHADAMLSGRDIDALDYQKLKIIARTQVSFVNQSMLKKLP